MSSKKGKEKEEKPEPQTFKFKSWSIAMEDRGVYINGIIEEDKKKVEFHTDAIAKVISEKEVEDKEGNTILLEGKFNREESIASGLSEEFVDLFKDGFFKTAFKSRVAREKSDMLIRIKMRTVEWTDMAFVGIEFDNLKAIYDEPFEFPDLDNEMTDGVLSHQKYPLYAFMGAQPHYLGGQGSSTKMLQVPYIVVIDCEIPPPNKIAYHSIQLGVNRVIKFENQKDFATFEWEPYIPSRLNKIGNKLPKPQVHTLKWTVRPTKINALEEEDKHYIEYLLPYILLPQMVEKEEKPEDGDTKQVDFEFKFEGKKYDIVFDKEIDTLSEFIPDFLEEKKLKGKCDEDVIKKALQEAFKKAREKKLKAWERRQKALENLTEKEKEGLRKIKLYKFYPSHPDIRKPEEIANNKINQYFGNADQVFFPEPPPIDEKRLKRIQKQEEEMQKKMQREIEREKKREKSPRRRSPAPKRKRSPAPKKKTSTTKKKTTSSKKKSSPKRRRKDESSSDEDESGSESESESSSSEEVKKKTPTKKKTSSSSSSSKKKTPTKKSKKEESEEEEDDDSDKSSSEEKPKKKSTPKKTSPKKKTSKK